MRNFVLGAFCATFAAAVAGAQTPARADGGPKISGPFSFENLSVYFIHGESATGPAPLTLQEAMAKGAVRVIETGSVNELKVENLGDQDVFIQAGDIVKGGRQDRVLTVSFILPRKSGEVPIASYCVEHGRWSKRGAEDATKFAGSYNLLPSREAKLAMKAPPQANAGDAPILGSSLGAGDVSRRQQEVWNEVARTQYKLAAGVNESVSSPQSASSLQLSLENDKLQKLRGDYVAALEGKATESDIVGFAFAINGRINSADMYPSNQLFRKMWNKLLAASVTEAVGEKQSVSHFDPPSLEAVGAFLRAAESGKPNAERIGSLAQQDVRVADTALFVQAAKPDGEWVHRNYLAK